MAKVSFAKLNCKYNQEVKEVTFNDLVIEVKQYLPISDKLNLISRILNNSVDDMNFYNPCRVDFWTWLEIIFAYTNIAFTDKQKENPGKLFDLFESSGLKKVILDEIPYEEISYIVCSAKDSIQSIYAFKNSVMGVLETVKQDYSDINLDTTKIQEFVKDPEIAKLAKNVLTNS